MGCVCVCVSREETCRALTWPLRRSLHPPRALLLRRTSKRPSPQTIEISPRSSATTKRSSGVISDQSTPNLLVMKRSLRPGTRHERWLKMPSFSRKPARTRNAAASSAFARPSSAGSSPASHRGRFASGGPAGGPADGPWGAIPRTPPSLPPPSVPNFCPRCAGTPGSAPTAGWCGRGRCWGRAKGRQRFGPPSGRARERDAVAAWVGEAVLARNASRRVTGPA